MTTTNTTMKTVTTGNGVTTAFPFLFPVTAVDEIVAELETILTGVIDPPLTQGAGPTQYTVALNTATEGGTVTMNTAPTSLQRLIVRRDLTLDMSLDLPAVGNVQEPQLEGEFDKQARLNIQIQEQLDRTPKQSIAETGSNFTFPEAVALEIIGFNAAGDDLESVVNPATAAATSAAAALVSETNAATSATNAATSETNAATSETNAATSATNASTSETNAAASLAAIRPSMTNKSGGGHIAGDVVIIDSANADSVKNSTTQGDEKVVLIATGTIADNASGTYQTGAGEIAINIKGSISIGDFVRISTSAKQAESAGATAVKGSFAQATASGTDVLVNCVLGVPAISVSGDFQKDGSEPAMRILRGVVNPDATINAGTGFTIIDNGTGNHTVTHTTSFNARPAFVVSVDQAGDINRVVFDGGTAGASQVKTFDSSDVASDEQFGFIIAGPN